MSYNKAMIIGRLGRDPEIRYTQAGTPVCNMSLATDESYKQQDGTKVEQTEWHKVNVWGKQAENVAKYLAKGRQCLVEGSLQTRKWQDQQGNDRYTTEIKASRVVFLGDKGSQSQSQQQDQQAPHYPSEPAPDSEAPF